MTIQRKMRIFVSLALILAVMIPGELVFAAGSTVSVSGYNAPSTLVKGKNYKIKGTIKSKKKIKKVVIGVVKKNGKWTKYKYVRNNLNKKKFKISNATKKVRFNKLGAGTYYYRINVYTSGGKKHTVLNQVFTVKKPVKTPGSVTCSGITCPSQHIKGSPFIIKGKIKASKKIKKVTAGVKDSNGNWTSVKCTKSASAKTFNMKSVDSKLKFGKLGAGYYSYVIVVTTTGGSVTAYNRSFTVVNKTTTDSSYDVVTDASSTMFNSDNSGIVVTNLSVPGGYKVGSRFSPSGTIQTSETITRVEAGIVYAPTNKWTSHKYDSTMNTHTFSVSAASSKLRFDQLPGGYFRYRIYVHTSSGVHLVLNHPFTVTPSARPQAAVNWAIKIANDNSFTYGKRPSTSKVGCYFCGTNQKRKPKGYEKTYVCMTFVQAAYAHGAGDPEILSQCRGGKYTLSLHDSNFKDYTCWEKIGLCKDLKVADLLPGDVICWYAADDKSGHLSIYAGNGDIVDAAIEGWSANSIAVRKGSAASYLATGAKKSSKSYVMRYRK